MKFSSTAWLLAAAISSASQALADANDVEPSQLLPEPPLVTPSPGSVDLVDLFGSGNHLELRQAGAQNLNGQAPSVVGQQPAVTVYNINLSVGNTITYAAVTFTQTFASVPDQLPSPIPGTIGLGNLVKQGGGGQSKNKREAEAAAGIAGRIPWGR